MNAREVALRVIGEVNNNGAYANIALANEINRQKLSNLDRRFITELVYGTIKAGATLDWILEHYIDRGLNKLPPVILNILRMGVYQLFFLSKVPPSAACNQSVELAKKYGHTGTVRFVNGVLRSASRNKDKVIYPDKETEPEKFLALTYFHPQWLISRWLKKMSLMECEQLCQINNQTPALSVRTNTLKVTRDELIRKLAAEGVVSQPSVWTPEGIICVEHPALASLHTLQQGLFQIQDESSMLVGHILTPQSGEFIIDACGAPGGKSTHIAALMGNRGRVLSVDLYNHKLKITAENAKRLGISILETAEMDAVNLHQHYFQQADRVLVDAPCSGLGVIRRKPDSRWRKNETLLRDLPVLQLAILSSAAQCVKPGGILVYSTCTTEPEENDDIVHKMLKLHPEFILEETGKFMPTKRPETMVHLWPHKDGVDGFFIARMKRKV